MRRPERLVMAVDLVKVGCLELQSDLHEHVGDVSGGLIGDGVFGQFERACSRHYRPLLIDLVLHAEAFAFDDDGVHVAHDAIENGGGRRTVIIEDLRPVLVSAVGGDHDRGAFVALADDLEQQVCAVLVDGEVAELVDDEDSRLHIAPSTSSTPSSTWS
jgi:hypothetical protein